MIIIEFYVVIKNIKRVYKNAFLIYVKIELKSMENNEMIKRE